MLAQVQHHQQQQQQPTQAMVRPVANGITAQEYYTAQRQLHPEFSNLLRLPQQAQMNSQMFVMRPQGAPPQVALPTAQSVFASQQAAQAQAQQAQLMQQRRLANPMQLASMNVPIAFPPQPSSTASQPPHLTPMTSTQQQPQQPPTQVQQPPPVSSSSPSTSANQVRPSPTASNASVPSTSNVPTSLPSGSGPDDERYQTFLATVRQLQYHMSSFAAIFPTTSAQQQPTQTETTSNSAEPKPVTSSSSENTRETVSQ